MWNHLGPKLSICHKEIFQYFDSMHPVVADSTPRNWIEYSLSPEARHLSHRLLPPWICMPAYVYVYTDLRMRKIYDAIAAEIADRFIRYPQTAAAVKAEAVATVYFCCCGCCCYSCYYSCNSCMLLLRNTNSSLFMYPFENLGLVFPWPSCYPNWCWVQKIS